MAVEPPICDFCSAEPVAWEYRTRDSSLNIPDKGDCISGQGWLACQACHELIQAGLRDELAFRSASRLALMEPGMTVTVSLALPAIRLWHDEFWANRKGEPAPTNANGERA
jgi:hypothetical protein